MIQFFIDFLCFFFLTLYRWYFRKIKRIEAEKKLLLPENEHGAFLIRDSESRHNDYSLSGELNRFKFLNLLSPYLSPYLNLYMFHPYWCAIPLISQFPWTILFFSPWQCVTVIRSNITAYVNWMRVDFSSLVAQHSGNWAFDFELFSIAFVLLKMKFVELYLMKWIPILIRRTLQELVEHYSKDSDGLCVNLRSACVQVILFNFIWIFFRLFSHVLSKKYHICHYVLLKTPIQLKSK